MKKRFILPLIIILGLLWLTSITSFADATPIEVSKGFDNVRFAGTLNYDYQPEIGFEYGLVTDSNIQTRPSIAHCSASNQYLIVYEEGGDIYGLRKTEDGYTLGGTFLISDGSAASYSPDVTCAEAVDHFLVVWHKQFSSGDKDLHSRLVHGQHQSGSQLLGTEFPVSATVVYEQDPAVACNADQPTCLVVFEAGSNLNNLGVKVTRVGIKNLDLEMEGTTGVLVDMQISPDPNPDVAWGAINGTYLVVWSALHEDGNYRIRYIPAYDTFQNGSSSWDEFVYQKTFIETSLTCDMRKPQIASSPQAGISQRFLITYEYDASPTCGDGTDIDIYATHHHANERISSDTFAIASTSQKELFPAIAYSGGTLGTLGSSYLDQYLVTYIKFDGQARSLMAQGVNGSVTTSSSMINSITDVSGEARELDYSSYYGFQDFGLHTVTGSFNSGQYWVVWEQREYGIAPDNDILGRVVYPACFSLTKTLNPQCPNCSISSSPIAVCADLSKYPYGTDLLLTAYPYGDYIFTHWSGDASGYLPSTNITMDADKSVTANFYNTAACYTLTTGVNPGGSGSVEANPAPNCNGGTQYRDGTNVTLTGIPASGYTFDQWSGSVSSYDNPRVVTMNGDKNIMANFIPTTTCYTLNTSVDPIEGGNIEVSPDPNCTGGQYTEDTIISLTANPSAGYAFSVWEGDTSGTSNPVRVAMSASKAITATFEFVGFKNVLIDEAHNNQLSLDVARAQEIEAATPWNDDWTWFYLDQIKSLLADKYTLLNDPDNPLTYEQLLNYDALIIPHYYQTMTTDEISAIKKFVASGGGVILLGDCGYDPPNPELNEAYWINIRPECVFMPYDEAQGLNGDIAVDNIWFGTDSPEVNTFTMNWGQSVETWGEGLWIADTWANDYETWRDDNGNDVYDAGEEGVFGVVVGRDTGCGRIAALGDNTFSDGALSWTNNASIFEALLDWVTDGYPCPVNQKNVLLDEYHDNHLSLDRYRAQEIVDEQGWGEPETYRLSILPTELINEFSFDNNPTTPLSDELLSNYEALIIPWYFEALSANEVQAVKNFVRTGGGLILIGDCAFDNPNPELAASYELEFVPECLFAPIPQFEGDITEFNYSYWPPVLRNDTTYTQNWGQWLRPNYDEAHEVVFWLADTGATTAWQDLDWDSEYDSGEEGVFDVIAGYVTDCSRVIAVADDAFGDSNMNWTRNDELLRDLLRWVTAGPTCELPNSDVYLPLTIK